MTNIMIIALLAIIEVPAIFYLYRMKKKGKTTCIGCPYSSSCASQKDRACCGSKPEEQ